MRKLPQRLAMFFILITIARVAFFVVYGLQVGPLGYAFAIGLAAGVYVTAYFIQYPETRFPAAIGLVFFLIADLWFNEFEMIRTLSEVSVLSESANFLSIKAETLTHMVQFSALVFGAFPTIAAFLLGWLQGGADKVKSLKTRAWFGRLGLQLGVKIASWFPEREDQAGNTTMLAAGRGVIEGKVVGKKSKGKLTAEDWDFIASHSSRQIAAQFGTTVRNARNWRKEVGAEK